MSGEGMQQSFMIRDRQVGQGQPCFVLAEAGSNHNKSLEMAFALVDAAAESGSDGVKFQTFKAQRLYTRAAGKSEYLGDERNIFDIIEAMEMPRDWLPALKEYAHSKGLAFISTPFDEEAVDILDEVVDAFKIASYELTHHPLLRLVASKGKPVIMSTGAANMEEIEAAIQVLKDHGCKALILLQCTAAYPAPLPSINVRAIVALRTRFGVQAGLSDHSSDPVVAPMGAVAMGAALIEKHYTLSKRLPGPDHAFAVNPEGLTALVKGVRDMEQVLGTGLKEVHPVENELRHFARRSLFTIAGVKANETLTRENLDVLRRGSQEEGLDPELLPLVLGASAARDLSPDQALQRGDFVIKHITSGDIVWRRAEAMDCDRVLIWANDPDTRAASFHSAAISAEDHQIWFDASLQRKGRHMFIAKVGELPVAFVRLDQGEGAEATVSINMAPSVRGYGMGAVVLRSATAQAQMLGLTTLVALIRPDNKASVRVFEKASYQHMGEEKVADQDALRYVLSIG